MCLCACVCVFTACRSLFRTDNLLSNKSAQRVCFILCVNLIASESQKNRPLLNGKSKKTFPPVYHPTTYQRSCCCRYTVKERAAGCSTDTQTHGGHICLLSSVVGNCGTGDLLACLRKKWLLHAAENRGEKEKNSKFAHQPASQSTNPPTKQSN